MTAVIALALIALVIDPALPVVTVCALAQNRLSVSSEVASGLNTTIFATPRGKIRVNLPDDMAAGDTLSGTVFIQPEGKDQKEQARNQGELSGYVIEMDKQQTSADGRIFKLAIPDAISTTYLILRDKRGEEIARREISVRRQPAPVEEFDLPTLGQQGRPVEVRGPCDGDFSTTNLKVGGEELELLAESPRKIVARNTSKQVGPSELEVKERNQTARGEFCTLGIKLSAPKLDLLRGEQTTLIVTVTGLQGIKEVVPLELENKSPSVIQMGGGEVQRINISPSQVQGGTYTTERSLTGIQRGAFTIIGTVISGRQRGSTTTGSGVSSRTFKSETYANLSINKDAEVKRSDSEIFVTYVITITNKGRNGAENVVVLDNLPPEITFISCDSTGGGVCGGAGNGRTITFPVLGIGKTETITLAAKVNNSPPGATTLSKRQR